MNFIEILSFYSNKTINDTKTLLINPIIHKNEILSLMSRHLQNKEIAGKLFISTETVKKHTKKI